MRGDRIWQWILLVTIIFVSGSLYSPSLDLELVGDDYQWVQFAHRALEDPRLLFADLASFYRPASTWTLAADQLLWGWTSRGYRLTNLVLHICAAMFFGMAARRLGLARGTAGALAVLWACSVFASEAAVSVAIRFQNLLVIAWWWLMMAWPREAEEWTLGRRWSVGGAVVLALFAKETWVTTPLLVFLLSLRQHERNWRRALRATVPVILLVLAYVALYFVSFPSDKSYYRIAASTLLKLPQMLAAYFHLQGLEMSAFSLNLHGLLAVLFFVLALGFCWHRRAVAGLMGASLMVAAILPTLWVPYFPLRYAAIPYAGFLLVLGSCAEEVGRRLGERARRSFFGACTVLVAVLVFAGFGLVRLEILDWKLVSQAHSVVLAEAKQVAGELPEGMPVIAIRGERSNPYLAISESANGLAKLWFVRGDAPYGLVDWAALFEWVLADDQIMVRHAETSSGPAAVLIHHEGGFSWLETVEDGAAEVARLREQAVPWTVIQLHRRAN